MGSSSSKKNASEKNEKPETTKKIETKVNKK